MFVKVLMVFVMEASGIATTLAAGRPSVCATEGKCQRGGLCIVKGYRKLLRNP
jgi:hypothetical protein